MAPPRRCNSGSTAAPTGASTSPRPTRSPTWPTIPHVLEAPSEPNQRAPAGVGLWPTGAEDKPRRARSAVGSGVSADPLRRTASGSRSEIEVWACPGEGTNLARGDCRVGFVQGRELIPAELTVVKVDEIRDQCEGLDAHILGERVDELMESLASSHGESVRRARRREGSDRLPISPETLSPIQSVGRSLKALEKAHSPRPNGSGSGTILVGATSPPRERPGDRLAMAYDGAKDGDPS